MNDLKELRRICDAAKFTFCTECGFDIKNYRHSLGCSKPERTFQNTFAPNQVRKLLDVIELQREALTTVLHQPFNGSWDAQAIFVQQALAKSEELLKND
jgi:hypothetical protein